MLRNVLGDYLDIVKEREFDLPFITLLPAMGFYDIHFTHGQVEFGKDFIAKRKDDDGEIQYSFQSKAGDISQSDWRNNIMGQMLESMLTGLSHPNFDKDLPHQSVLITTGRLMGNAALGLQDLNRKIQDKFNERPVIFWGRENLVDYLEEYGLGAIHRMTPTDFVNYGNFYVLYGKALQGKISDHEIEQYSRQWLNEKLDDSKRLLGAAVEGEILAQKCSEYGFFYEAIHAYLGVYRATLFRIYDVTKPNELQELLGINIQANRKLYTACYKYFTEFKQSWIDSGKELVKIVDGPGSMITYLVNCARILEISGCLYFMEGDKVQKSEIASFIQDFIAHEPGCTHIPSDRYAVSLVFPVLALCDSSQIDDVRNLLHEIVVWLCDRYEEGFGLAPVEADAYQETVTLLGYPFEFIPIQSSSGSFLATVVCDLTAYLNDKHFYGDVVNDIKASKIFPQYWQASDTKNMFQIEGADVITYPSIDYKDDLSKFESYEFAEHIIHEPRSYRVVDSVGALGLMVLMLLLRDRYFPTLWPVLTQE